MRLFKSVLVEGKDFVDPGFHSKIHEKTIEYGFIFSPEVLNGYDTSALQRLIVDAKQEFGLSGAQVNKAFHKSWDKVRNTPMEQLVAEQIIHYITTYGFELLGVYDEAKIFIPNEVLCVPELDEERLSLIVIRGLTQSELKSKLLNFLGSGIALSSDTIDDVIEVADLVCINQNDIDQIKNKEVLTRLYDKFGLVPKNPTEFLRYVVFKLTDQTLLVKSKEVIRLLKYYGPHKNSAIDLFNKYEANVGLERLAEIFFRFKPIFLALRLDPHMKRMVNKIRRLADKHHKPMSEDYLNTVTAKIKNNTLDLQLLQEKLSKVNIFRKVRLAQALSFRLNPEVDSILYKIRNGKGYAQEFTFDYAGTEEALHVVFDSMANDLSHLDGVKVYVPDNIVYVMPATEKQFTGMFPSGTYVTTDKNLICGIYWEDDPKYRIDLDLSLRSLELKIGWDARYRAGGVLFSGDITAAPYGAAECHYIPQNMNEAYLSACNFFNARPGRVAPFKIFAAFDDGSKNIKGSFQNFSETAGDYLVDPNNIAIVTSSKMLAAPKQKFIGLVTSKNNECRFYFSEVNMGNTMSLRGSKYVLQARKYLVDYHESMIKLEDVFTAAGAIFTIEDECDINLSPELLEKDTFINLLTGKEMRSRQVA